MVVARELALLRREGRKRRRGRSEAAAAEVEGEQEDSSTSATFAAIALATAETGVARVAVPLWHVLSSCRDADGPATSVGLRYVNGP